MLIMTGRSGRQGIRDGASGPRKRRVLGTLSRLRKLQAMSPAEIGSRLRDGTFALFERARLAGASLSATERLRGALSPEIVHLRHWELALHNRRHAPPKFFPGVASRQQMRDLFRTEYAAEALGARRHADLARRHEFEFFGRTFQYGPQIDWHADPISGRRWPRTFHRDVPVHGGDVGFGDVKYVWELNRHQFLIDLGKAEFLEGTSGAAAGVRTIVGHWISENPYGVGVNWASPLEPAFRVFSWLWAYYLCLGDEGFDREAHLLWLAGFHDHGRFLHRHLEYYSSPFNHLIGEAAALYALGVLFPEFREARAWRRRGRDVLESRVTRQFYPDGGSVEQSTFYHHATLGFYILSVLLGRAHTEEFSREVWAAIERGVEFSMHLVKPDGRLPAIGGADDGKAIRMEHLPFWDFRPFQAIGAVMFNRPDFKYVAGRFFEDALWLLGPDGLDRFTALRAEPPRDLSKAFEKSGYIVLRSGWSDRADYVCFDCGEQAAGVRADGVTTAVHGHADCLSVTVCLGGRPVLVDPGFYCYNGDKEWETYFRRTAAHTTVRVDGRDQARHLAKMMWSHGFTPRLEGWSAGSSLAFATGSHDGFARGPNGVLHRRIAWLRPDGYVALYDEIVGGGVHAIELNYQLAPGVARLVDGSKLVLDATSELAWTGSRPLQGSVREGGASPDEGWIAPSLGVRVPAPRLSLATTFQPPRAMFLTAVADLAVTGGLPRLFQAGAWLGQTVGLIVQGTDWIDWIVAGGAGPLEAGPFETDAPLAIWRIKKGRIVEAARIGGTYQKPAEGDISPIDRESAGVLEAARGA